MRKGIRDKVTRALIDEALNRVNAKTSPRIEREVRNSVMYKTMTTSGWGEPWDKVWEAMDEKRH